VSILAQKKATAIMREYSPSGNGEIVGLRWQVRTPNGDVPFILPVNVEAVERVLKKQYDARQVPRSCTGNAHARRVAWRITLEWVKAQMALLETEMVTLEQLFLPYMRVGPNETLYQRMLEGHFQIALLEGRREG